MRKTVYKRKVMTNEITIPDDTLKKTLPSTIEVKEKSNEPDAIFHLMSLDCHEKVNFAHELRICIDTSEPLSEQQVNQVLAYIRLDLSRIQRENKDAKCLLAKNMNDLVTAYETLDIKTDELVKIKEMHKASIPGLNSPINAKNFLCGLIILHRHTFECLTEKKTLEVLYDELSKELKELDNEKFSSDTIYRAYKDVKKYYDNQVKKLQSEE